MRNETFAFVITLLVTVSALGGYYAGSVTTRGIVTTTQTTTAYLTSSCSTPVHPSNSSGMTDVYQLAPGSVGVICVDYEFDSAGYYSFASPNFGPLFISEGGFSFGACGSKNKSNGSEASRCSGLKITPSLTAPYHLARQDVTVAYNLQTGANVTGLYWFFIANCDPIPIAIGPLPKSVPYPFIYCISISGSPSSETVTGVSNINVALVPSGLT
ncbi:MAG: hypothetical protein HY297_04965 [Thaumarchaeota archaeon]|nr:hypothetical protein [Nitrososphaerota archaeon]